ncbi:MAG: hypothetical protein HY270_07385 [Deltaproteobacteria bacterium]|nr:hypothetical protein [Deltaproteobacteria bacterium]
MRFLRIALFTILVPLLSTLSQQVSRARGNEAVPGTAVALCVVGGLFLVRAAVTEWGRGAEYALQKDVLWGIGGGALIAAALQWL